MPRKKRKLPQRRLPKNNIAPTAALTASGPAPATKNEVTPTASSWKYLKAAYGNPEIKALNKYIYRAWQNRLKALRFGWIAITLIVSVLLIRMTPAMADLLPMVNPVQWILAPMDAASAWLSKMVVLLVALSLPFYILKELNAHLPKPVMMLVSAVFIAASILLPVEDYLLNILGSMAGMSDISAFKESLGQWSVVLKLYFVVLSVVFTGLQLTWCWAMKTNNILRSPTYTDDPMIAAWNNGS